MGIIHHIYLKVINNLFSSLIKFKKLKFCLLKKSFYFYEKKLEYQKRFI